MSQKPEEKCEKCENCANGDKCDDEIFKKISEHMKSMRSTAYKGNCPVCNKPVLIVGAQYKSLMPEGRKGGKLLLVHKECAKEYISIHPAYKITASDKEFASLEN